MTSSPTAPSSRANDWKPHAIACALLAAVTVGLYFPVVGFDFVNWDDTLYVTDNLTVQSGLNATSLYYAWNTLDYGNWIPLTWMSYLVDIALFGQNPHAMHAVNLFWHVANVCLVYLALWRLTAARGRSAVVALFFAIHPLHVESVAWIAERKDVLSTFFLLTTLLAYEHYARRPSRSRMLVVAASFACGLMSKPMLVTTPVLLLLLDYWPLRRIDSENSLDDTERRYVPTTPRRLIIEKLPLFAMSLAIGLLTIYAQKRTMAVGNMQSFPLWVRVGNSINGFAWYLLKTFVPTDLYTMYPHPLTNLSGRTVAISAAGLLLAAAVLWCFRRRGYVVFGTLWFIVSLLPVIGLLQVGSQAWADRYAYIPHIGLFVLIVWGMHDLLAIRGGLVAAVVITVVAASASAFLCWRQIATWRNSDTLWSHALRIDPDNPTANYQWGWQYLQEKNYVAARPFLEKVIRLSPNDVHALVSLGIVEENLSDPNGARSHYERALRLEPANTLARDNLARLKDNDRKP